MFWLYDLLGVLTGLGSDSAIFFQIPCLCSPELSHWSKWDCLELINIIWADKGTGNGLTKLSILYRAIVINCSSFHCSSLAGCV